ncbi:MAG: hypothetical protein ACP5GJ_00970 [Nanopusillaceae archaeon]|jgi:hypothetical protein
MKNQINFINFGIILIIVGIAIGIYFSFSMNLQKNQQREEFTIFLQNLQNLANTIYTSYGNYYIELSVPKDIILYSNNSELIINYQENNYTVIFYNSTIYLINNNEENVSFLIYPSEIYILKYGNNLYITPSLQFIQNIMGGAG